MTLVAEPAAARVDERAGAATTPPAAWKPPDLRARRYDIVVSYRRRPPDLDWVRDKLIPRLRECGLSVFIDAEGIPGGADWRATIADAIDQCQHVIVVLSPEWVSSGECFSEAIAAFQLDPLGVKRKVIPLHFRECFDLLPGWLEWLKRRNFVDFRNALDNADAATGNEWNKLLDACRSAADEAVPACPLDRLASSPVAVAKCSGILHGQLQPIRARVATIGRYKDLHEFFHRLETPWIQVDGCLRELGADLANRRAWREIQRQVDVLVPGVNELASAAHKTLDEDEADRVVGLLVQGTNEIKAVLAERQSAAPPAPDELMGRLEDAARDIRDELARQPPLLNEAIVQNARSLALDDLLAPLRDLGDALRDEVSSDLLRELDDFLHSLVTTQESLEAYVEMHGALQVLHDELIRLDPEDWSSRDDFRRQWRGPERRLSMLRIPTSATGNSGADGNAAAQPFDPMQQSWRELPWARELVAIGEYVSQLVKVATLNLDDARDKFELFRSRVFDEFRTVDFRLREQCTPQVRQLVEKLTTTLTSLDAASRGG